MSEINETKPLEPVVTPKKKRAPGKTSERVSLPKELQSKLDSWIKQIHEVFNGMVRLKKNELVCILLQDLPETLSASTLGKIKNEKLTDLQKAKWIYDKLRNAETKGESVDLEVLYNKAQGRMRKKKERSKTKPTPFKKPSENVTKLE